jgi:hypothetical protein
MDLDLDALAQEFNIDVDNTLEDLHATQIDVDVINNDNETINPDVILSKNINKANALLDRIIIEINNSGMNARLGEVAGQLLNVINQSVNQIYSKNSDYLGLRIKKKMVELKEREVKLKELTTSKQPDQYNQNNIILTDRETLLKMLKENKKEIKLLEESKGEIHEQ